MLLLSMFRWYGLKLAENSVQWRSLDYKTLASIKGPEFVDQLSNYQLLKKDPTSSRVIMYHSQKNVITQISNIFTWAVEYVYP
jgi:hypothetical protein